MAKPRHLNHAPITEALIDIQVEHREGLSFTALQDAFSALDFDYYFKGPIAKALSASHSLPTGRIHIRPHNPYK